MGRKSKKSKIANLELEAEKQQEKIRNSILKVFRARLSDPCGGGALLVGKDKKVSPSEDLQSTNHTQNDSFSSSMSDSDDSHSKACQVHTRTRRKRRCKRRPKRSKVASKVQDEKSAVTRHLRAAHDVRDALHLNESADKGQDKISLITVGRLTNKVGLFNKGRKSETISRDIHVSDSVKRKTEDDLRNIISHSDENGPSLATDIEPSSSAIIDNVSQRINKDNLLGALKHSSEQKHIRSSTILSSGDCSRNSAKMSITPVTVPISKQVNLASSSKSTGSVGPEEKMPETPPYEEIAVQLMHTVKPRLVFPGQSILDKTREELQKLMRQNAPRSATPTPNFLKLGGTCTGSVKRSLLERFSPENNQVESEGYLNNAGQSEIIQSEPRLCDITKPLKNNISSNIVTDAHVLLKCNDLAITETKCSPLPNNGKTQNFNPDARKILCQNDSERAKKFITIPQYRQDELDTDFYNKSQLMKVIKTKPGGPLQLHPDIHHDIFSGIHPDVSMDTIEYTTRDRDSSQHDSQSSRPSLHSSQTSSISHPERRALDYNPVLSTNKAVVAELRHYPQHLQLQNGTYYSDSLNDLLPAEQQQSHKTRVPMDFLDMLDSPQPKVKSPVAVMNMLKSTTPDSDGSPLWLPIPPPFLKKPTFDTPSPPDKLYPRLLY